MKFHWTPLKIFLDRKAISFLLMICQVLSSGCIHTPDYETKNMELPRIQEDLSVKAFGDAKIRNAIYLPSKLPLADFFSRVRRGEFTTAFKKIDLNYRSSNTNDEVLENIIESGFIPVYVEIKNQGQIPLIFNEKNFTVVTDQKETKAFYAESLPQEFKKFNSSAAAANVINTGIVIVGFAAVLGAMIFIQNNSSGGESPHPPNTGNESQRIYNNITKTTHVDYKSYLISATTLKPGESKSGLLFFYVGDVVGIDNTQLIYTPSSLN